MFFQCFCWFFQSFSMGYAFCCEAWPWLCFFCAQHILDMLFPTKHIPCVFQAFQWFQKSVSMDPPIQKSISQGPLGRGKHILGPNDTSIYQVICNFCCVHLCRKQFAGVHQFSLNSNCATVWWNPCILYLLSCCSLFEVFFGRWATEDQSKQNRKNLTLKKVICHRIIGLELNFHSLQEELRNCLNEQMNHKSFKYTWLNCALFFMQ